MVIKSPMKVGKIIKKDKKADLNHLERRDWELLAMAILMILVLTFYILISHIWEMADAPREWFRELISVKTYLTGSTFLILLFCLYIAIKNMELRKLRRQLFNQKAEMQKMVNALEEIAAFYEISSQILSKQDLEAILASIVRESLNSLRADRAAIYLLDKESRILRAHISHAPNPLQEKVSLLEEREMARKAILQDRPFLLSRPEDFQGFFNYDKREDKISSLICYPFHLEGKPAGALTVARLNQEAPFTEDNLKILSIFGQYASLAMENANLAEEVKKKVAVQKNFEQYSQRILEMLQEFSEEERKKIEDQVRNLFWERSKKGREKVVLWSELGIERRQDERANEIIQVEFADHLLAETVNISGEGVFIRTNDPLDLEEEFFLKLHLPDGHDPAEILCKVVWTNKYGKETDDLPRGMGVKFIRIKPQDKKRIEDFIQLSKSQNTNEDE